MTKKKFDCVEMMHQGQAAVRERLKGMTLEEKLDYWRKREEEILARQKKSQRQKVAAGKR